MKILQTIRRCTQACAVGAIVASTAAAPALAQQCSAAGGGPPCESFAGIASLGDPDGSDLTVGNPIHPITGNKYQEELDAPPLPGFLGLEIRRHFNSRYVSADGAWGRGWSLSYDTRVHRTGAMLQVIQADGRRFMFGIPRGARAGNEAPAGVACAPAGLGQGQLFIEPYGFRWLWPQQRELVFDHDGYLTQIRPRGSGLNETTRIERNPAGLITRVTDPAGRSMQLGYDSNGYLSRIDHPLGQWLYRIDAGGRVESVVSPDGMVRRYSYEDMGHPSRFTAITAAAPGVALQVLGQWSYDSQGRAVSYRRGDGGELRMAYAQDHANSVLTNALGARTYYKAVEIAGRWRVTEIRGPGCEQCGPGNIGMRYDEHGQLLARWKSGGGGHAFRRDAQGRVVRITRIAAQEKDPDQLDDAHAPYLQRLEYPDEHTHLPRLVARPSVIPGKEHRVVLERDEGGNLVRLTESGYAPDVREQGGTGAQPIARTLRLHYERIAGRLVLVEMDGPLPNGAAGDPSDSDVTRFRYDDAGRFPLEMDAPGGSTRRFVARDRGDRPVVIVSSDGHREVEERLAYNLRGQVIQADESAWLLDARGQRVLASVMTRQTRRGYDLEGRLVEEVDAAGRVTRYDRDGAGRLRAVADGRGYRRVLTRDTEGQVRVSALHRPDSDEPLRAAYFGRTNDGRLQSLLLPDGRRFHFYHDVAGRTIGYSGADGHLHLPGLHLPGRARMPDRVGSAVVDDFGRVLRQETPDHGARTMRFDEAGRLVGVTDALGVQTRYRYDAADRLLERTVAGAPGAVNYDYEGRLLARVDDPAQGTSYRRDALGRIVETSVTLVGLAGVPLRLSTTRDPRTGLVTAQGLAGGQSVQIHAAGTTPGAAQLQLQLRNAFWTAVAELLQHWLPENLARVVTGLLPQTIVARDIDVDPFDGLAGFTHGNGIRMSRQFDLAGRTVRLRSDMHSELHSDLRSGLREVSVGHWRYTYGAGPWLRSIEQVGGAGFDPRVPGAPAPRRQVFAYDSAGALASGTDAAAVRPKDEAVELDRAGRVVDDGRYRYSYSAFGQVEAVAESQRNRPVAAYAYNHRGQRTRKTVYGESGEVMAVVYYLWSDSRIVAEIEPDGTIVKQYLSLDDGRRDLPIAILQRAGGKAGGSKAAAANGSALMALHTDHRGAPVAMSDARQRVVWRADLSSSGMADVLERRGGAELNLRLPGQYWDAETGLHDNWHRSYDPRSGQYLQPDPLGYPDGLDTYAYAGGDPVNRSDPLGLYQIDVHYYMTFFLGVTAGLDPQEARIVALAAQYVDDNPLTRPMDATHIGTTLGSVLSNQRQLLGYHFVLSGADGRTLPGYRNSRLTGDATVPSCRT